MSGNDASFAQWLDAYGRSWVEGDPQQVVALFAPDALYYETPFDEPLHGREAIRAYWTAGAQDAQRDVTFTYTVLSYAGGLGVAHWRAGFTRVPSGSRVQLDGILQAGFDDNGRCAVFREWWHRQESPAPAPPAITAEKR